jgi:hypothetical protein
MSNNPLVYDACSILVPGIVENGIGFVVFGTVAFAVVIALMLLVTSGGGSGAYDQIGRGGLSREGDHGGGRGASAPDAAAARAEQEREMRQMLGARSERLVRRGEPALDIDAEIARLLEPARPSGGHEAALVKEVRQLVVARNERRVRQGLEALDVEAETSRTLREMDP